MTSVLDSLIVLENSLNLLGKLYQNSARLEILLQPNSYINWCVLVWNFYGATGYLQYRLCFI